MCYIIITGGSLVWFILSLIADMFIVSAIVTPKWLIGPHAELEASGASNLTAHRYPSVGIYSRCKTMAQMGFRCGRFDLDGFSTDGQVYPGEWKAAMFFISLGFAILTTTVFLTLLTCCRQSVFGKSIHNITACAQVVAGISVMMTIFLHPMGWGAPRVLALCGPGAEPFYPSMCSVGISFYCAVIGSLLCFVCAGISLKAESSNMRTRVRRRVEEGDRLVCIP